jgi:CRISPR-associated protein Cmr4
MTTTSPNVPAQDPFTPERFYFMALDPVHIGAGGYRLGRVDMTIAREPGTQLPKIPGTSLAGAARSYAAIRYGKIDAAGQHKKLDKKQKEKCPIIYTFGTATDTGEAGTAGVSSEGPSQAGTVSIGDAHILFFPVNSMAGPLWVSTKEIIQEVWGEKSVKLPPNAQQENVPTSKTVITSLNDWNKDILNLGWLLFTCKKGLQVAPRLAAPQNGSSQKPEQPPEWIAIANRIVLVDPKLFSQIVNSNLEVRTSVSIDPRTGAAAKQALFTYEAIPRTTWLYCDVVEDNYRRDKNGASLFPPTRMQCKVTPGENDTVIYEENQGDQPLDPPWYRPLDVVKAGMRLIEYMGIGGMGTRGFGRMRVIAPREASNGGKNNAGG